MILTNIWETFNVWLIYFVYEVSQKILSTHSTNILILLLVDLTKLIHLYLHIKNNKNDFIYKNSEATCLKDTTGIK